MAVNSLYSPYGAFELKFRYQRNLMFGTLITTGFVAAILVVSWVISAMPEDQVEGAGKMHVIETVAQLGPPPSIAKVKPQINVAKAVTAKPKIGIPKPVADDEVIDENVVLATRDELADIVAPDITETAGGDIVVDISDDEEFFPAPEDFVAVEIYPEMIFQAKPEYPRLAKQAGITGVVWVQALVDKEGNVRDARVGKTSGTQSLDEAAVAAAFSNKFKPGIQNGRPVAIWVTYKVEFTLSDAG